MIRVDAVWLATEPIDMRAGTDTALARVVKVFGAARPHHAYVFANRRSTRLKVLVHDGIGSNTSRLRLAFSHQVALPRQPPTRHRPDQRRVFQHVRRPQQTSYAAWTSLPGTSRWIDGATTLSGPKRSAVEPALSLRGSRPASLPQSSRLSWAGDCFTAPSSEDRSGAAFRQACPGYSGSHCIAPAFYSGYGRGLGLDCGFTARNWAGCVGR
jgi:hypothetical protein